MNSLKLGTGCKSSPSGLAFRFGRVHSAPRALFAVLLGLLLLPLLSSCCRSELETATWRDISASLSPDGSLCASIGRTPSSARPSLSLLELPASGQPAVVKPLNDDVSSAMPPVFSPDGKSVLFLRRGLFHMILMSQPIAGGEAVELASLRVSPQHLQCLRSNSSIAFVCFMEGWFGVSSSLKVYNLETGVMREIENLPGAAVSSAALSADGRVFVYGDGRGLWRIDLSAAEPAAVSIADKFETLDRPLQFALSNDGSLFCLRLGRLEHRNLGVQDANMAEPDLAKTQYKTVDLRRLVLVDLSGSKPLRVLAKESSFRLPAFSPDSSSLAYVDGSRLCVLDLESGSVRSMPCPSYEFGEYLEWFDAKRVLFQALGAPHRDAKLYLAPASCEGKAKELFQFP